jgi:BirA family biotin operon repressor/biotin-[acetyl-CoA-carboxylase] ligase
MVVFADEQERGRGRLGRSWVAPPGSALLCSVLLRPSLALGDLHFVTTALAVAALDALERTVDIRADLKWPNDLLVRDKKLGGLLAELAGDVQRPLFASAAVTPRPPALVIGLGINLEWPGDFGSRPGEEELGAIATTCAEHGVNPGAEALLAAILEAFAPRYEALSRPIGRVQALAHYRQRCSTIGRTVRVVQADGEWQGVAEGISDDGQLLVRRGDEVRSIEAGDVIHVRPAVERT